MKPGLGAEWPFSWVAVPRALVVGGKQNERSESAVREMRKLNNFYEAGKYLVLPLNFQISDE